jgi:Tfp pilus assembly protein PilF
MSGSRSLLAGGVAAVVAGACVVFAASAAAEPYRPPDDAVVLERLPSPADPRVREARVLARDLAARPGNLDLALEIARRYVALGTAEGDPRYIGLAQGVLAPWWRASEPPPGVRLLRAAIGRARHDFEGARVDLDAIVAADPSHAQAHLDRAALLEVLGDFLEAERACFRVARLRPGLIAEACMASAGSLSGMAGPSYEALAAALEAETPADDGGRLWALTILGEIAARKGDTAAAERHFIRALALGRRDVYLLAAYADLLLDQARYPEVAALLEGESANDLLLLRRALAARHLGDPSVQEHRHVLEARFAAIRLRGDIPHLREEARFALLLQEDAQRALELARQNWARQRGPADARILLEAALTARAPEAARPVLEWLQATRIEDVALTRLAEQLASAGS